MVYTNKHTTSHTNTHTLRQLTLTSEQGSLRRSRRGGMALASSTVYLPLVVMAIL